MVPATKRIEFMRYNGIVAPWWGILWAWRWRQPGPEGYAGVSLRIGPLLVILGNHRA